MSHGCTFERGLTSRDDTTDDACSGLHTRGQARSRARRDRWEKDAWHLHRALCSGALIALFFAVPTPSAASGAGDYERRDDLTEAVIACEEAHARLEKCCPGFVAGGPFDERRSPCLDLEWRHTTGGCTGPSTVDTGDGEPLAIEESDCIRRLSCDELVASGGRASHRGIRR